MCNLFKTAVEFQYNFMVGIIDYDLKKSGEKLKWNMLRKCYYKCADSDCRFVTGTFICPHKNNKSFN